MPELADQLLDITGRVLAIDKKYVTTTARIVKDLGADSIDCIELMMALEDAFRIEIPDDCLSGLTTIEAVASFLQDRADDGPAGRDMLAA